MQTQPDWVIHCAALANLDACEAHPVLAEQLNTDLPAKLAAHVARGGARLLHVSTDAVFDGQRGGYTEQDTPNPLSIYARTKLDGERGVADANPKRSSPASTCSAGASSGKRSLAEFFFNNLSAGKPVMGFTDVYFCPLLANDLAAIFLKMLQRNLSGLYHVVSRECLSKYEFGVRLAGPVWAGQQPDQPHVGRAGGLDSRPLPQPDPARGQAGSGAGRAPGRYLSRHAQVL